MLESTAKYNCIFSFVNSTPAKSKQRKSSPSYLAKRGKLPLTYFAGRTLRGTSSSFSLKTKALGSTPATSGAE